MQSTPKKEDLTTFHYSFFLFLCFENLTLNLCSLFLLKNWSLPSRLHLVWLWLLSLDRDIETRNPTSKSV